MYPSSTTTPLLSSPHLSNSNVGAIVGGVIGGIGAALIGVILFFLWRRWKYKKDRTIKPLLFSGEKPLDGGDGSPAAGVAASDAFHHGSFPLDTHCEGAVARSSGPETSKISTDPVSLYQHGGATAADYRTYPAGDGNGGGESNTMQQPSPARTGTSPPSHFNPASFDYRPPEKAVATDSNTSSRTLGPSAPETHANPSSGDVTRVAAGASHDCTTSVSSYPMGSAYDESSRRDAVVPMQQGAPAAGSQNISLTQISQDVNRILTHLGRLRITPGEPVEEDNIELGHQAHPIHDAVIDDGTSPPEYGEYQHHHEGAPIRAPLPPIPLNNPR
jgi:hypothetical protein